MNIGKENGITLIAIVITIIVLLILAGVSIAMLTGDNGILTQAQRAKEETERAAQEEQEILNSYEDYMKGTSGGQWDENKKVNTPRLVQGMTEVSFELPEGTNKGETVKKGDADFDENNWYDYEKSEWANAVTQDGSYWVWIPRFAYKITYNNSSDKSQGGKIDVKFLIGTTDKYYDDEGNIQTAKRAKSKTEEVDTTSDYYVHPAFTDESNIDYANGGWDKEIPGIWVAKFEAGFASGNNNALIKSSSVNYSQDTVWVYDIENGGKGGYGPARNWLDGIYGKNITAIKYPTFQPVTYAMNYINVSDRYDISRVLTESGNIYGLSSQSTDSHLMKNSEWGAVAYLSWSEYGANKVEPYKNNINLNSGGKQRTDSEGRTGIDSVYVVTGLTTKSEEEKIITKNDLEEINKRNGNTETNEVYVWDQEEGQKASSTLNMYGIYDLNGGGFDLTAAYIANDSEYLMERGESMTYENGKLKTKSTKYTTVYPYDSNNDTQSSNYVLNKYIYGDAIRETSSNASIDVGMAWNGDASGGPYLVDAFFNRGGGLGSGFKMSGLFNFGQNSGDGFCNHGFRAVLIPF